MLELKNDALEFSFSEVHQEARFQIDLMRTLRIPDDDKEYPLPPGLGRFPLRHIEDFKGKIPEKWSIRGGVILPMYQSEAMWLNFTRWEIHWHGGYPMAVKVSTGKVSALTGKKWKDGLRKDDYIIGHKQKWLDGYVVEDGTIRQFVAEPLGMGLTAEGQITGKEEFGGIQIEVFPLKRSIFDEKFSKREEQNSSMLRSVRSKSQFGGGLSSGSTEETILISAVSYGCSLDARKQNRGEDPIAISESLNSIQDMGLAAGGRMRQQVFNDEEFSISDWDTENGSRVFIHLVNSMVWQQITGKAPPLPPLTAAQYSMHNYPWYDHWNNEAKSLKGTKKTASLKSIAVLEKEKGVKVLPENQSLPDISKLIPQKPTVSDGKW